MNLLIRNINLPYKASKDDALIVAKKSLLKFFSQDDIIDINLSKKSIDARNKNDIKINYSFKAVINSKRIIDENLLKKCNIEIEKEIQFDLTFGNEKLENRPVVVGFGPAGMFASYLLTINGYKPIVIERGSDVNSRKIIVDNFYKNKILNEDTNIQFGAGGAGTFSDGKLMTRINNSLSSMVIDIFYKFGANSSILYEAKPHIGTDQLIKIINNFSNYLIKNGCEINYNTKLENVIVKNNIVKEIITSKGSIPTNVIILATGHSSRDTISNLRKNNLFVSAKPFSIGFRIEHLQKMINESNYGILYDEKLLPPAEYSLSTHYNGRGIYTFCMCPGGVVVPAMSNMNTILTNGMSNSSRNGVNSNSAICCSINLDDIGNNPDNAELYIESIEKKAYLLGGENYMAPAQTVGSFLYDKPNKISSVLPTYMDGYINMCDISGLFEKKVSDSLKYGIVQFGKRIKGFDADDAILTAPETRTSSPVRIDRKEDYSSKNILNLYPCGEGAGYAGGITSAAVDGLKCAQKIINRFKPIE